MVKGGDGKRCRKLAVEIKESLEVFSLEAESRVAIECGEQALAMVHGLWVVGGNDVKAAQEAAEVGLGLGNPHLTQVLYVSDCGLERSMKITAVILTLRMNNPTMKMSKMKTPTTNQRTNSPLVKNMTRNLNMSTDLNRGCTVAITTSDMTRLMSRAKHMNGERPPHRQLEGESPPQLA